MTDPAVPTGHNAEQERVMARKWADLTNTERAKLQAYWDSHPAGQQIARHARAGGVLDHDYAIWRSTVELLCQRQLTVSCLDFSVNWRDHDHTGRSPTWALVHAMDETRL